MNSQESVKDSSTGKNTQAPQNKRWRAVLPWLLLGLVTLGVVVRETQPWWHLTLLGIFDPGVKEMFEKAEPGMFSAANIRYWGKHGVFRIASYTYSAEGDGPLNIDAITVFIGQDYAVVLMCDRRRSPPALDTLQVKRRGKRHEIIMRTPLSAGRYEGEQFPSNLWLGVKDRLTGKKQLLTDMNLDGVWDYMNDEDGFGYKWKEGQGWVRDTGKTPDDEDNDLLRSKPPDQKGD